MADRTIKELISRAAPLSDVDLDTAPVREAAYAVVIEHARAQAATQAPDKSSRRRHKRLVGAASILALVAGIGTAAAQELLPSARTGDYAEPEGETPSGGEWIRLDAPDAPDVLLELSAPIPLPPGTDPNDVVSTLLTDYPTSATAPGLQGRIAWISAACEWPRYWLDSRARGDSTAMADAQAVLDAAPTWEWITGNDGGGIAETLQATADGLRRGDSTHAEQVIETNC